MLWQNGSKEGLFSSGHYCRYTWWYWQVDGSLCLQKHVAHRRENLVEKGILEGIYDLNSRVPRLLSFKYAKTLVNVLCSCQIQLFVKVLFMTNVFLWNVFVSRKRFRNPKVRFLAPLLRISLEVAMVFEDCRTILKAGDKEKRRGDRFITQSHSMTQSGC